MKRIIILVLLLYAFGISGMAAQIHYCGGEFETISFGFDESTDCCCEGKSSCKNCCKNEQLKPNVSNHFSVKSQNTYSVNFTLLPAILYPELLITKPIIKSETYSSIPFKDYNLPDFIRHCVYRL